MKNIKIKNIFGKNKFTFLMGFILGTIILGSAFAITGTEFKQENTGTSETNLSLGLWNRVINQAGDLLDNVNTITTVLNNVGSKVGIGTNNPVSKLTVNGGIQIGGTEDTCADDIKGTIRYSDSLNKIEFCNGTDWQTLGSTTGADIYPDDFSFGANITGVVTGGLVFTSATVTLSGFDGPLTARCPACNAMAKNGTWMTGATSITGFMPGDSLAIRLLSAAKGKITITGAVSCGNTISNWTIKTADFVCGERITDPRGGGIDGKGSYDTIKVGTQCWMRQNMNVGTRIYGAHQTNNSVIERYCYGGDEAYCDTTPNNVYPDGGRYRFAEALQYAPGLGCTASDTVFCQPYYPVQGICPNGFHIPNDSEWYTLENYLTDSGQSCDPNRGSWGCYSAWTKLRTGGTSGLEFNLAGLSHSNNVHAYRGSWAYYVSSTDYSADGYVQRMFEPSNGISRSLGGAGKTNAVSVRCIKD